MSITTKILGALNQQIKCELESAYIYWAMAAECENRSLKGCAAWLEHHAGEELEHAKRLYRFVNDRGGAAKFMPLAEPKSEWGTVLQIFEEAYVHEQYVSSRIHTLLELARSEKDYATEQMLQWFLAEQVEEEDITSTAVEQLKLIGNSGHGLYLFDLEMGNNSKQD